MGMEMIFMEEFLERKRSKTILDDPGHLLR